MPPRGKKRAPPKKKLITKLKQDPIGTAKAEVKKTGALQVPIGAFVLGMIGGAGMASQMKKIPVIGGVLSIMASKGASTVARFK